MYKIVKTKRCDSCRNANPIGNVWGEYGDSLNKAYRSLSDLIRRLKGDGCQVCEYEVKDQ